MKKCLEFYSSESSLTDKGFLAQETLKHVNALEKQYDEIINDYENYEKENPTVESINIEIQKILDQQ